MKNKLNVVAQKGIKAWGSQLRDCNHRITLLVIILTVFGVMMVLSAGYYQTVNMTDPDPFYYLKRQGFFAVTGFIIMLVTACIDYHNYAKFAYFLAGLSIVLLLGLFAFGTEVNGATRWYYIFGIIPITPSEFSKLFMIIFTASYIAYDPSRIRTIKGLAVLFVVMFVHVGLIYKQPNLSTAIVIALIMLGIMFAGDIDIKIIGALVALLGSLVAFVYYAFPDSHWHSRIASFTDPFAYAQGDGYQVTQGLIALGNGGLFGLGPGNSITKNLYLPEPQNDFILAIIGEELGFVGYLLLLLVYIFLLFTLIMTAARAKDRLGFLLATGVAVMLGLQVAINIAVVTSSMPATGITLPFVSYGGSSLWSFMFAMGIALNVSKGQVRPRKAKKKS